MEWEVGLNPSPHAISSLDINSLGCYLPLKLQPFGIKAASACVADEGKVYGRRLEGGAAVLAGRPKEKVRPLLLCYLMSTVASFSSSVLKSAINPQDLLSSADFVNKLQDHWQR